MIRAKTVADTITAGRSLLGVGLLWLGLAQGASGLATAMWMLIANWTADCLDGPIARRSRPWYRTWIGDHDLEVDILVSGCLLGYMAASSFVPLWAAAAYVVIWGLVFWWLGVPKALGMLSQAPVYGGFIWVALREIPEQGWCLPAWILAATAVTWPRFPNEILPGFLNGMRALAGRRQDAPGCPRKAAPKA
jgi:phosphatidylglycerophosphate synthase